LLLSSTIKEENEILGVDLVNAHHADLPDSAIHIRRAKFLLGSTLFERIQLRNYHEAKVAVVCSLNIDGDFRDIFELRGVRRRNPPGEVVKRVKDDRLELCYQSLDKVRRELHVE